MLGNKKIFIDTCIIIELHIDVKNKIELREIL